jgi:hypothetical protein
MTITEPARARKATRIAEPAPPLQQENPVTDTARGFRAGANLYGAFSIETFCSAGSLSLTHDDAQGFLTYTGQFNPHNFWYKDAGVKIWAYGETYDDWQDTYGMDAVRAAYHSGHGAMDVNGVFYVPMGAAWAGNDCTATSTIMRLGNEYARYVFWSTCESLRVLGGHSPVRTWSASNLGLRMIFGFETVSWDDHRYGSGFWNHWKSGETFSSAWLNSSWDIAHDQSPSVSANGATAQEAQDRLYNERFFDANRANTAWWWWRWYNTAASAVREPSRSVPRDLRIALLAPPGARSLGTIADRFGVDATSAQRRDSVTRMTGEGGQVSIGDDGLLSAILGRPNLENRSPLARQEALAAAESSVRRFGLDADAEQLVLDRVVELCEGGASTDGDGQSEGPFTTGTMVQYRQVVNGLPVITPNSGAVRVTIDNDGNVTNVQASTRTIEELSGQPRATTSDPTPPGAEKRQDESIDPEAALTRAFSGRLRNALLSGPAPVGFSTVPGSTEVGYDIQESQATLIAQRAVEVEFANGYRKRYWVKAPLFG